MAWSAYESKAWTEIQEHRRTVIRDAPLDFEDSRTRRAGQRFSDAADKAKGAAKKLPGAGLAGKGFAMAGGGLAKLSARLGTATLSETALLKAYRKRGIQVASLRELRTIDLEYLDAKVNSHHLELRYGMAAAVEGAATGAALTAGEIAAIFGGVAGEGVGAAPGLGTVATVVTVDAAAVFTLTSRAVAHTALHYGFDPADPLEQIFALGVINAGSAFTQGAKVAAFADLSRLTQALARNAPWIRLNEQVFARVIATFAERFSLRLTKQKLGQLVPFAGIAVGAGLNYSFVSRAQETAYWAYRERFLLAKGDPSVEVTAFDTLPTGDSSEPAIEVVEIIRELGIDIEADDPVVGELVTD